jgi:prolipoprotein diacylglyceryltransferase
MAAVCFVILYLFWRRVQKAEGLAGPRKLFAKRGCVFPLMFILYGVSRFSIELLRDDNPFEFAGLTISQLIGLGMIALGTSLMVVFQSLKPVPRGH